jgi:hypothetical protein
MEERARVKQMERETFTSFTKPDEARMFELCREFLQELYQLRSSPERRFAVRM